MPYLLSHINLEISFEIRVLRVRPGKPGSELELEYIPNNLYSFQITKTILRDYTDIKARGSRFWDDQCVRHITSKTLYSIHDYCPGMPINLEQQCDNMRLDPFRPMEIVTFPPTATEKRPLDVPGSIE
jgi:hypothetical protein